MPILTQQQTPRPSPTVGMGTGGQWLDCSCNLVLELAVLATL